MGLIAALLRWVWSWRVELALVVVVATIRQLVLDRSGLAGADIVLAATLLVLMAPGLGGVWLPPLLRNAAMQRRWHRALAACLPPPATPVVREAGTAPVGEWVTVQVAAGSTVSDLASRVEHLAACLDVDQVRVSRHPRTAALAFIRSLRYDPLSIPAGPWPYADAQRTSLWQPIPVGVDENGQPIAMGLFEHNLLVGGEPGSGKSVAISQLVAATALDPTATVLLLDGKLVELAAWRPIATGCAGVDIGEGVALLQQARQEMDCRYQHLLERGLRKMPVGTGLVVVVIDELAHYLTWPDKRARDTFTDLLRDLVSRGRAAGVVVIAATQKPSSEIIPTGLRDLFGYRWAMRCTTGAASDTILGGGWATQGHSTHTIRPDLRGVGLLLHETGLPQRLRAYHLDDADLAGIARRAQRLRSRP